MKLAIRIAAMSLVFAGLTAASFSSKTSSALPSHLSATATGQGTNRLPVPICGPFAPCSR